MWKGMADAAAEIAKEMRESGVSREAAIKAVEAKKRAAAKKP